ncbi:MAG: YqcC family protein [Chitinophagaceae bacterium]|nr:YqcC family protein [Chitinophagaceae bacterium]
MVAITAEQKTAEIVNELKKTGLWKKQMPAWVTDYEEKRIANVSDFSEWLQFIYLPNCKGVSAMNKKKFIVPQAVKFFGEDVKKGRLLQLLIELDALT